MLQVRYEPPVVNPIAVMAIAAELAEEAGAHLLLEASLPLVPRDTGALAESGRVTREEGPGAAVVYDAIAPDGYCYAAIQHERTDYKHPRGGQAKYLEQPMHSSAPAIAAVMAESVRKLL